MSLMIYRYSHAGTAHVAADLANQDASCTFTIGESVACNITADGMGGCMCGGEASRAVVDCVFGVVSRALPTDSGLLAEFATSIIASGFLAARNTLGLLAAEKKLPLDEFGTTLMVSVYDHRVCDAEGVGTLYYGYVGDGGLLALTNQGEVVLAEEPQKGAAHNLTSPVTAADSWRFGTVRDIAAVMTLTDGLFDAIHTRTDTGDIELTHLATDLMYVGLEAEAQEAKQIFDPLFSSDTNGPFAYVTDDRTVTYMADPDVMAHVSEGASDGTVTSSELVEACESGVEEYEPDMAEQESGAPERESDDPSRKPGESAHEPSTPTSGSGVPEHESSTPTHAGVVAPDLAGEPPTRDSSLEESGLYMVNNCAYARVRAVSIPASRAECARMWLQQTRFKAHYGRPKRKLASKVGKHGTLYY